MVSRYHFLWTKPYSPGGNSPLFPRPGSNDFGIPDLNGSLTFLELCRCWGPGDVRGVLKPVWGPPKNGWLIHGEQWLFTTIGDINNG